MATEETTTAITETVETAEAEVAETAEAKVASETEAKAASETEAKAASETEAKAASETEAAVETRIQTIDRKLKAIANAIAMCKKTGIDPLPFLEERDRLNREKNGLQALTALKRIEADLRVIKNAGFAAIKLSEDAPTLVQTWPVAPAAPAAPVEKAKRASRASRASRDWLKFENWLATSGASLLLRDKVVTLKGGLINGLPPGQAVISETGWTSANAWATLKVALPTGETLLAGAAYDRYVEG